MLCGHRSGVLYSPPLTGGIPLEFELLKHDSSVLERRPSGPAFVGRPVPCSDFRGGGRGGEEGTHLDASWDVASPGSAGRRALGADLAPSMSAHVYNLGGRRA